MRRRWLIHSWTVLLLVLAGACEAETITPPFKGDVFGERLADGDGLVEVLGERQCWHKITVSLAGPFAHERDNQPNPFTDYRFTVAFTHAASGAEFQVPGYFAADGDAANSGAEHGTHWVAHFAPPEAGEWQYAVQFSKGEDAALTGGGQPLAPFAGQRGSFMVEPSDKTGRDFRGKGRLQYVGSHLLRFAGSGESFLKAGADAPETFLAYTDFDGTVTGKPDKAPLKTWQAHERDWSEGDPTWQEGKGKGMIGAINYLSGKGGNVFSFLTYNAGGDGDNVWPFLSRDDKFHYDCSKLDQWGMVFDHATARGMYLHFKLQETEMDDLRGRKGQKQVPTALDGGDLGRERRLYLRELVARFGHQLALNWNLGEENTQSTEQQLAMADYLAETDPYDHLIVVHSYPDQQDKVYRPLLGKQSPLRGASLQNSSVRQCHKQVVKWVQASAAAGVPWVIGFDEPGTASEGMPADPGYPGMPENFDNPSIHDTRKFALWGTLMGGGAGVEYYFGYKLPQNDLLCEDWRSRDRSWDYCRVALQFFREAKLPLAEMANADALVGNPEHENSAYCHAKPGAVYLVYLPEGGERSLDLSGDAARYTVSWFDPENDVYVAGDAVEGGGEVLLRSPQSRPGGDWLAVLRSEPSR